ncbi:MAG: DUF92 domain-containing protein [Candidatus Micrarchaeota archaeon]|nr:DUF92 domain-containing protein [Candidatus Micrarchaeota archaeon]MDE1824256.1 DUF92 domain-containing protein [Candidatus Micrarchaeota archaeon]MDE1849238.1 DUF92 domain-containing protein [Candidatus Micrarchaeota archaeon]
MVGLLTLDSRGIVAAFVLAVLIFLLGGAYGFFFIAVILTFLVISALVTLAGRREKLAMASYRSMRGWRNVAANGIVPLLAALGYSLGAAGPYAHAFVVVYVASVAAAAADKFGSELGVLDGSPVSIVTFRKVKKGVSGAVTPFGLAMSLVAAVVIAVFVFVVGMGWPAFVIVAASGFIGSLVDSLFGHFEEKGIGDKYTTNIMCAASAFIVAFALSLI